MAAPVGPDSLITEPRGNWLKTHWPLLVLLLGGIGVRLAVLLTASPFNPDLHLEVIQYVATHHRLPISNQLSQSYHPPLYYLLTAPLYRRWPDPQVIHAVSFGLSCINLALLGWLISDKRLIPQRSTAILVMALAAFLPQFVMFSSFISNDSLTLLVGTLIFLSAVLYARRPDHTSLIWLAVAVATGLLTKGTFILTAPALALLILRVESRRGIGRAIQSALLFLALTGVLGCYKYVENQIHFGHPIVHNLDAGGAIADMQRGVWKGWQTLFDINIFKLIRRPILQIHNVFSYPLLMYATFWYPHIPDSSFRASVYGYEWVGSILYALAIVPTLLFLLGLSRATAALKAARSATDRQSVLQISWLLLISNLTVVLAAGIKYDVWSCFQSRLCFQSIMPVLVIFAAGMELIPIRWITFRKFLLALCWLTVAACILYFVVEIAFVQELLPAGAELQP